MKKMFFAIVAVICFASAASAQTTLPETMEIELNFYQEWPFIQKLNRNQTPAGETYTFPYVYEINGVQKQENLKFVISAGEEYEGKYSYFTPSGEETPRLVNSKPGGYIMLPGIKGMHLRSVSMSHSSKYPKQFRLQKSPTDASANYNSPAKAASDKRPVVTERIEFPTEKCEDGNLVTTWPGKSYCMYFKNGALRIHSIKLVYTAAKPE